MTRIYIGWDPRDAVAYEVCRQSLLDHASIKIEVRALKDWELRARGIYWRTFRVDERGQMWDERDGQPFSTAFSYTRYCVPLLEEYGADPVVFCDADMLWRADIAELLEIAGEAAVACVQHTHVPPERQKMTGTLQCLYPRKNWSSLMVLRPSRCRALTAYAVNNRPRAWLHEMRWVDDGEIKALPEVWNWLDGWSDPALEAKIAHFTRGTPDMPGYENTAYAGEWRALNARIRQDFSRDPSVHHCIEG